jgi:hypothetical protein
LREREEKNGGMVPDNDKGEEAAQVSGQKGRWRRVPEAWRWHIV